MKMGIMEFRGYHELKWNMRFSLSFCLKPRALLMWFIKQLSAARPPRQMHSMGCEEEIPVEAAAATGLTTGSPAASPFPSPRPRSKEIAEERGEQTKIIHQTNE